MNRASSLIATSVLLAALLPLTAGLLGLWYVPSWNGQWFWRSEPLHSTVEAVSGFSALTLGIILVLIAGQEKTCHPNVWLATALVAKGTLDLFHAGVGPELPFVWLRCLATFVGGALFAAAWLPRRLTASHHLYVLPVSAGVCAAGLACFAMLFPYLPGVTFEALGMGPLTRTVNMLGGLMYLAAAAYFLKEFQMNKRTRDLLWLSVSLLFGVCALMFDPSLHWSYAWWFWHAWRLIACILCLTYFLFEYSRAEKAVRVANDRLAQEVIRRRQAQEQVRDQNRFLNTVIESLAYPFYVLDAADRTIKIANAAASSASHPHLSSCYEVPRGSGRPCSAPSNPCPLEEVCETGRPTIVEHVRHDEVGNLRHVEVHAHPIADSTGKVVQIIEYCLDVTDRKRHDNEREHLIAELASKNAELERFTYTVSHDLKSPLITIKGFLGYVEKDMASGNMVRLRSDIARIRGAVSKMSQLLDDLLELSRVGRIVNPPEHVPMDRLVKMALDLLAGRITERGITVDIPADLPVLYGDPARLREVLENLLDNAVKFAGNQPHPRVEIQVREDDDQHTIRIQDNGIGLESQYKDKIFQLFERLGNEVEGTGIGLAIVKRIVEVHGGTVWVESEGLGRGSAFCFTLPKENTSNIARERNA